MSAAADDGCKEPPADTSMKCCEFPKHPFADVYKKFASEMKNDIKNPALKDCVS